MLVLITYDVSTTDAAGKRRLRQVAKKISKEGGGCGALPGIASTTAFACKIPYLSAAWMRHSFVCCKRN